MSDEACRAADSPSGSLCSLQGFAMTLDSLDLHGTNRRAQAFVSFLSGAVVCAIDLGTSPTELEVILICT